MGRHGLIVVVRLLSAGDRRCGALEAPVKEAPGGDSNGVRGVAVEVQMATPVQF